MNREFGSDFKFLQAIPATLVTNADITGNTIDTLGFGGCVFVVNIGQAQSAVAASYVTLRIMETVASANNAGPSDFAYCVSADLVLFGSQYGAVTSGIWYSVDSTAYSGTVQYLAYRGNKRYVRLMAERVGGAYSGISSGCVIAAIAMLGLAEKWPAAGEGLPNGGPTQIG